MFKSSFATYPRSSSSNDTYAANLGRATRAFLAALLPVKRAEREFAVAAQKVSPSARTKRIRELYLLAADCDSVGPRLAAELRLIAEQD